MFQIFFDNPRSGSASHIFISSGADASNSYGVSFVVMANSMQASVKGCDVSNTCYQATAEDNTYVLDAATVLITYKVILSKNT